MSCERLEHYQLAIRGATSSGPVVMSNCPIHSFGGQVDTLGGAALFFRSDNNIPVRATLHDSADGITWNVVLFSTHAQAGLLSIDIAPLSFAAILFTSCRAYFRISVGPVVIGDVVDGEVVAHLVQWPPRGLSCPDLS